MRLPNHIAIIMDGNGRWGVKKYKNRILGHEHGIKNIKPIIKFLINKKIKNLTLYAFSKDNFLKRNRKEVKNLFLLLEKYLDENKDFFINNKINLNFIGERNGLPKKTRKIILKANKNFKQKKNNLLLNIAFNYSSKSEIINSCKEILKKNIKINQENLSKNLYTSSSQDPELIIRTGGYQRLSDFLLWQASYSEIYFVKKLWPDFKTRDLNIILKKFDRIKRNFGA